VHPQRRLGHKILTQLGQDRGTDEILIHSGGDVDTAQTPPRGN